MERCSYFIKDKALFGSFPTQASVERLEEHGVRCFVDLTGFEERKTIPYRTKYKYIKYPILDHTTPKNWKTFAQLILQICKQIRELGKKEYIYIHCKGGHGRAGIVVACTLCHYYNISPEEALKITTRCHSKRPEMREKWRKLGSPQGKRQKDFVLKFFRSLRYDNRLILHGYAQGMSNHSPHSVDIPEVGLFPTAHHALQSFRSPSNSEYIEKLKQGIYDPSCIDHQKREWETHKVQHMYRILNLKFTQHANLRKNLINTGLRPLIKVSKDSFWGDGGNGQGKNMHGRILAQLRTKFLDEEL